MMKRRFAVLALLLVLCAALTVPSLAAGAPRLIDEAGLLSEQEAAALEDKLDRISGQLDFDVVVCTVNSLEGMDPEDAACRIYEDKGYGFGPACDGVILLINMGERDWVITSTGFGEEAVNEDAREYISGIFLEDLSAGNYAEAFNKFADESEKMVKLANDGQPYKTPFNPAKRLSLSAVIGALASLFGVSSMKGKLKSVAKETKAANYVIEDSLNVTDARERYLYCTVSRTARAEKNDNRSSGSSHSSSSGKF